MGNHNKAAFLVPDFEKSGLISVNPQNGQKGRKSKKKWENTESSVFLKKSLDLLHSKGGSITNIDLTYIRQNTTILIIFFRQGQHF